MFESILPNPLHPAVVHFPIVFALLVPLFAIGALVMIQRKARPLRAWGLATALFVALSFSAWAAVETGEDTSETVESVVAEAPLETHEEAAENFLRLSVLITVIAMAGLAPGRVGQGARLAAAMGALVLLVAGWRVGHSGGALVYQHGAASAYSTGSAGCRDCRATPETH